MSPDPSHLGSVGTVCRFLFIGILLLGKGKGFLHIDTDILDGSTIGDLVVKG